ncbi:MAG TPA: YbaK/EbsC family protein [Acidimicrobiia bacterium]|nr:YbaK/EbsC family protein [Acidimicrobiia bacterium]
MRAAPDPDPAVARVRAALEAHGLADGVTVLADTTRTATDAASALGCAVAQIVKSLVFRAPATDRAVLVLASGAHRVDPAVVGAKVGEDIEQADARFVRERCGFEFGGVAPVGHLTPPVAFVDETLFDHDVIWAAGGSPHAVFSLTPAELAAITGATVGPVR